MREFDQARRILISATGQAFPAAVLEVGRRQGLVWEEAFGRVAADSDAPPATLDTIFDLASLTKVIATTTLAMVAADNGQLRPADRVSRCLPEWRGTDRATATIEDLLEHASGLTDHLPLFRDHRGRQEFERAICTLPLEYAPRTQSIYSDLGFMLLGFIIEDAIDSRLDAAFARLAAGQDWGDLGFLPGSSRRLRSAPTEVDPWRGRLLAGEVHDENAHALGGIAGHAGMFGTAREVGAFARTMLASFDGAARLASPATFGRFMTRSRVPGSSRALGWDTMLPASSCGTRMSPAAIGHTGFTGTSLWIDPTHDLYVVLLTNRVHPTRANEGIRTVRPALHDAIVTAAS